MNIAAAVMVGLPSQILQLDPAQPLSAQLWVELFGSLPWLTVIEISRGERELFGALISEEATSAFPFLVIRLIGRIERKKIVSDQVHVEVSRKAFGPWDEIFFQLYQYHWEELESQVEPLKDVVE